MINKSKPKIIYCYHNLGKIFSDQRFKSAKAHDATMKFLRDKAVSQQDKQALRSKRIQGIAYLGLNQLGDLRFACKSEDGTETYLQSIRFYDFYKRKPKTRDDILNMMRESDVGVYCNDPSFLYWGAAYNATKGGYNIVVENRPPTKHLELKNKFVLCKHMIAVLRAVPFYWNNMVKDFMEHFKINEQRELAEEKKVVETKVEETKPEEKGKGQFVKPAQPAKPAQSQSTKREDEK